MGRLSCEGSGALRETPCGGKALPRLLWFRPGIPVTTRTALITGGTRGIGLGIARALATEHWDLMLGGVRPEADVAGVLDELRQVGGAVHYVAADLAAAADRARLLDEVRGRVGVVNALV